MSEYFIRIIEFYVLVLYWTAVPNVKYEINKFTLKKWFLIETDDKGKIDR